MKTTKIALFFLTLLLSAPLCLHAADTSAAETAWSDCSASSSIPLAHEIAIPHRSLHMADKVCAYSPSGHQLAVYTDESHSLSLVDTETGSIEETSHRVGWTEQIAYHPTNENLLFFLNTCDDDGQLINLAVLNLESGEKKKVLPAYHFSISGDGKMIVSADHNKIYMHDLDSKETRIQLHGSNEVDEIYSIAVNSDGTLLAFNFDNEIKLYSTTTEEVSTIYEDSRSNSQVVFTADDSSILFEVTHHTQVDGREDKHTVRIMKYDLNSNEITELHKSSTLGLRCLTTFAASPRGDIVLTDYSPGLKIIDGTHGSSASEQVITEKSDAVSIACNRQGTQIASLHAKCVRLWNLSGGQLTKAART